MDGIIEVFILILQLNTGFVSCISNILTTSELILFYAEHSIGVNLVDINYYCYNIEDKLNITKKLMNIGKGVTNNKNIEQQQYSMHHLLYVFTLDACNDTIEMLYELEVHGYFQSPYRWLMITNNEYVNKTTADDSKYIKHLLTKYIRIDSYIIVAYKNASNYYIMNEVYKISNTSIALSLPHGIIYKCVDGVINIEYNNVNNRIQTFKERTNIHGHTLVMSNVVGTNNNINNIHQFNDMSVDYSVMISYSVVVLCIVDYMNGTLKHLLTSSRGGDLDNSTTSNTSTTGSNTSTTGSNTSTTGSNTSTTGSNTSTTGSNTSTTGSNTTNMFKHLYYKDATFGTLSLITKQRLNMADFVSPVGNIGLKFVLRKPRITYTSNVYRLPFSYNLWYTIIGLMFTFVLFFVFILTKERKFKSPNDECSYPLLLLFHVISQQGCPHQAERPSGKILIVFIVIATTLLYSAYTANIDVLMRVTTSESINNINTLACSDTFHFGISTDLRYIKSTELFEHFGKKKICQKEIERSIKSYSNEEGIRLVRESAFAFYISNYASNRLIQNTFKEDEKCDLINVDVYNVGNPWIPIQKQSPYKEISKLGFLRIQETGLRSEIYSKFTLKEPKCTESVSVFGQVGINEFEPVVRILLIGWIASLILLIMEILWRFCRHQTMDALDVEVVHFYPKNNAEYHHTINFEVIHDEPPTTTIVRRGQPFTGVIRFTNRTFNPDIDIVHFIFTLGDKPKFDTEGKAILKQDVQVDNNRWSAKILATSDNTVTFEIFTPANTPIGAWSLNVITKVNNGDSKNIYQFDEELYILFNPWCNDDQTYMEDIQLLDEYILTDVGKIWRGTAKAPKSKEWFYGQFDRIVLPACMLMLDQSGLPYEQRGDPVKLSRAISRTVNSFNNTGGILCGSWTGVYNDGTAPSAWIGSVDILTQYLETQEEVFYGQCWVFAGVLTTVCRAVGIPSRPITNFVSAHDSNHSLTIDKFYNEHMEEMHAVDPETNEPISDSIWNFHVWNDVWMARPDLPPGYGGWQAVDATPQETSDSQYQCGPASVEAIKQGLVGLTYDVSFMLATVNADLLRWKRDPNSELGYSMVNTNKYHIGRQILTKKPHVFDPRGDTDKYDITHLYKHNEGTQSERLALMNGVRNTERARRYYSIASDDKADVMFDLVELDKVDIGDQFIVKVLLKNNSDEPRNIKALLKASSVYYNGVYAHLINDAEGNVFLAPGNEEEMLLVIQAEDYINKLVEHCIVKISGVCTVIETNQSWADEDDLQIVKPTILIKTSDEVIINNECVFELSFSNPLNVELTDCNFKFTSSGLRTLSIKTDNVGPKEMCSIQLPITPNRAGQINYAAVFNSKQLQDITGSITIIVYDQQ